MKHIISVLLLCILGSLSTAQAVTPAGTVITNQVEASYIDPAIGVVLTSVSNEVSITLRPVAAVLLEQALQQIVAPGEIVYLTHTLSNFGNVPDSFVLTVENLLDDDADLLALKLYHDTNANGLLDSGELEISTTHELASGTSIPLVIKGTVADTDIEGSQIKITLSALSQNKVAGIKAVSNVDTLTVSGSHGSSQQQTQIRFLTPTRAALENDGTPDFYKNEDFVDAQQYRIDTNKKGSRYDPVRDGIYVEIHADDIEIVPARAARKLKPIKMVSLVSVETGDSLQIAIREIAANAGIYRSIRPIRLSNVDNGSGQNCPINPDAYQESQPDYAQAATECVLRSVPNDRLRVTVSEASATTVIDTAVVEPLGVVFDIVSGQPIANMQVSFMAANHTPARDPISGKSLEGQITDSDGQFRFPALSAGQYYIAVTELDGQNNRYQFPSSLAPSVFPDRTVSHYSYGENGFSGTSRSGLFSITADKPTLTIDIPVDPAVLHQGQQLALSKQVSSPEAMLGDLLTYTISITNQTGEDLHDAQLHDFLPAGFKLVANTVSLMGERRDDLAIVSGRKVDFVIGELPNETILELVYVLRVSAEAQQGDAINRAYLTAKTVNNVPLKSAQTHAKVRIRNHGVLSSEGMLFGKVYFDKSCDYGVDGVESKKKHKDSLLPLGGIRLYLDDGRYAITDGAGDYSFYGMEAALHTIKLDAITLPKGVTLKTIDTQQANDPYSYFIDITSGDYHRADFVANCLQGKSIKKVLTAIAKSNKALRDTDFLSEAGTSAPLNENIYADLEDNKTTETEVSADQDSMPISKKAVKKISYQQGKKGTWLWPKNNISTDGRFMAVIRSGVKKPVLYVNDEAISIENMGEQLGNKKSRAQLLAWYGVELEEGENTLIIKGVGPRGKMRTLAKGVFIRPSRGIEIKITPLKEALVADGGRSSLPLKISILDKNGHAAIGDYFLTLLASEGQWEGKDIQDTTEGHQIKVSHGEKVVYLRSSSQTGKVHISVKADTLLGETDVSQVAHLRPLFATGYVNISAHSGGRRYGRAKFFMKGKVWGDKHLTLSFDSDKPYSGTNDAYREELNKSYYPIHGDAGLRGYEARSRSKLFAKLEKGKRSIMWGDYQTDELTTPDLARVQRTLNGVNINVDTGQTQFQLFAAQENDTHITEEFRGNGTASNYQLDKQGLVPNSEVIELIIRDRVNTGLVISSETLQRLVDFTLDPVTGYLTFHRVIPSLDNELNPVYIRVSYDMESSSSTNGNTESYLVSGARVRRALSDEVTVGASYTHDDHTENGSDLVGGYMTYKPDAKTEITASSAQMTHINGDENGINKGINKGMDKGMDKGRAYSLSARHEWSDNATSNIIMGRTDKGFTNSNGGIIADRQEIKLTHTQKLDKKTRLNLEGTHSESLSEKQQSQTLGATLQTRAGKWLLEGGMRHIEQQSEATSDKTDTARIGVKRSINLLDHNGRIGVGYEQDIKDSSRNYLTADAEIAVNKKSSVYARYETGSDLTGSLGLAEGAKSDRFVFGAKAKVLPQMELYSEFRSRDLTGTRSAETASGLRGSIEVEKGLNLTPSLEVVKTTEGETLQDSVAASLAVTDLRDEDNRKTLRVETRQGEINDYYAIEGSYITKLDDIWSGLIREELHATTSNTDGDYGSHTFTLGLAQRQRDDGRHNGLYLYQWKEDRGVNASSDRTIHLLSTHQHYQANDELEFSARLGGKIQTTHLEGQNHRMDTVLLDGKTNYEFNDKVDLFVRAGVLASDHFNEQQYSAGVGVNVTVKDNLRIGVGYNETGFKDEDLDADKQNADGFFVNLMMKADESWFEWMQKKEMKEKKEK